MPGAEVTEPVLPAPGKKKNRRSRGKKNKSASSENAAPQAEAPADPKAPPSKEECGNCFSNALNQLEGASTGDEWCDSVDLSNKRVGDKRVKRLAQCLTESTSVTMLDFSFNNITDEGASALCEALAKGGAPQLVLLNLHANSISNETHQKLIELLAGRTELVLQLQDEEPAKPTSPLEAALEAAGFDSPEPASPEAEFDADDVIVETANSASPEELAPDAPEMFSQGAGYTPPSPIKVGEDSSPYVTESLQTVKDNLLSGDNDTLCEALDTLLQVLRTDMDAGLFESFQDVGANIKMFSTLLAAPSEPAEHTTGTPKEGLGVKRYLAASIVCMCIQIPELESVLLEAGVCNRCLSLFFEFNFSSCLHFSMVNMLLLVIPTPGALRDSLMMGHDGGTILKPQERSAGLLELMGSVVLGEEYAVALASGIIGRRSGVIGPLTEVYEAMRSQVQVEPAFASQLDTFSDWEAVRAKFEFLLEEQEGGLMKDQACKPMSAFNDMANMGSLLQHLPPGMQQQLLQQMMGFGSKSRA